MMSDLFIFCLFVFLCISGRIVEEGARHNIGLRNADAEEWNASLLRPEWIAPSVPGRTTYQMCLYGALAVHMHSARSNTVNTKPVESA